MSFTVLRNPVSQHRSTAMKFMKLKEVIQITSLSRATIYRLIQEGEFPKQIPLSGRSVAWLEEEINEWMQQKLANR